MYEELDWLQIFLIKLETLSKKYEKMNNKAHFNIVQREIKIVHSIIETVRNKHNNPLDNIMSCQEAAELWNLNPDYIRELCNKGKVKAKNIGKTWIIDKNQPSPKKY